MTPPDRAHSWRVAPAEAALAAIGGVLALAACSTPSSQRAQETSTRARHPLTTLPVANWPTNGGDVYNRRYSPLTAINRDNVANLKGVWLAHLAGMPLSEYVRRRRMTAAAADLVAGSDDLLTLAVRYGYGSAEAFGRAFQSVHGVSPGQARRDGGPFRTQPCLRFRLTVEGAAPMDVRLVTRPAFRLVGHAARVPLVHEGVNPAIQQHVASLTPPEHQRLKALGDGAKLARQRFS